MLTRTSPAADGPAELVIVKLGNVGPDMVTSSAIARCRQVRGQVRLRATAPCTWAWHRQRQGRATVMAAPRRPARPARRHGFLMRYSPIDSPRTALGRRRQWHSLWAP